MEEKLSALEGLGILEGLAFRDKWNVHSKCKAYTPNTPISRITSTFFPLKTRNVIERSEESSSEVINENIKGWSETKVHQLKENEKKTEQDIPLKTCLEMEMKKSEIDIPEVDKSIMSSNCDKNFFENRAKSEGSYACTEKSREIQSTLNKKTSSDETSEEVESSESEEANHEIANKVPSTVQEWVNHLPSKNETFLKENSDCIEPQENPSTPSDGRPVVRAELSREASLQSSSSLESILDSRRPDPVEIFLNLGFGGLPGVDTENCRIPKRFLVPSQCKGGDWDEFLKRELLQAQNFECSSLGFRGLSAAMSQDEDFQYTSCPSYRRPSAIVANIMEKLRERTVPPTHNRTRLSTVAKKVLSEKSVLNKLTPEFQSVLSPDSRKFLQNQGKKSPEVPRRRIIFGQKSFAFAHDGEFVEVESSNIEQKTTKEPPTNSTNSDGEESAMYTNPEVLLKLRRSSFQKQKKVEEDTDVDDVFYVVGSEDRSNEPSYNKNDDDSNNNNTSTSNNNSECSSKAGKIPRRFLSSGNLKGMEENNLSEAIRLEVEKEILSLSQKIKSMSTQDLSSVLQHVKELRSKIENGGQASAEM